ncbi:MAG: hypothetical protein KG003_14320 [Bacteroidetes bacterium]|nr:hypothetical protein [Bacteroidota bacterium]
MPEIQSPFFTRNYRLILLLSWLVIFAIRFAWPADMEYKADEKLMVSMANTSIETGELPAIGMKSGIGLENAGFSAWPFVLFAWISNNPLHMAMMVMVLNFLALLLMAHCANLAEKDSYTYKMGVLLAGVNLMAVLFSRKIWAQDLLPVFTSCIWYFYLKRNSFLLVIFTGIFFALAGQLHLSGFFYAAGFFLSAIIFKKYSWKQIGLMLLGFAIGLIPALLWIKDLLLHTTSSDASLSNIIKFEYFLHLLIDPLGINAAYSLGSDVWPFSKMAFFLPVILTAVIGFVFLFALIKACLRIIRNKNYTINKYSEFVFYAAAFILFPGILLTLSGSPVRSHYLIGATPFVHIALVKLIYPLGKKYIWLFWISQAVFTICFLYFIHTGGIISGDYGLPYSRQAP